MSKKNGLKPKGAPNVDPRLVAKGMPVAGFLGFYCDPEGHLLKGQDGFRTAPLINELIVDHGQKGENAQASTTAAQFFIYAATHPMIGEIWAAFLTARENNEPFVPPDTSAILTPPPQYHRPQTRKKPRISHHHNTRS